MALSRVVIVAVRDPARGGDAAAAFQHDQQDFDRAVAQRVGEHDILADELVAFAA